MAQRYEQQYKVKRGDNLGDPEFWNKRLQDIDLRVAARELDGERIEGAVDQLAALALRRLDDTFTPIVNEAIDRLSSVGALFSSTSDTETTISAGSKTFLLDADTRTGFVVPEYVAIRPTDHDDRGMIGQAIGYDRATGLLDVSVVLFSGAGSYDSWQVRITGAPDIEHSTRTDNPHATTAAQVGAYTIAQVNGAIADAVYVEASNRISADQSEVTARSNAIAAEVTARNGAIAAAIDALKGGVSTAYDTLVEIAARFASDDSVIGGIMTSLGKRLRFDAPQALTSAEKDQASVNLGTVRAIRIRTFTASTTYVPDPNLLYAEIEGWAGGAAGGGTGASTSYIQAGQGGGAGGYSKSTATAATIGASKPVVIGAAGAQVQGGTGGTGGDTSLGSIIIAKGGVCGGGSPAGTGTDTASTGAAGGQGWSLSGQGGGAISGGSGGSTSIGGGGIGTFTSSGANGGNGTGFGGGGAGGSGFNYPSTTAGGAGYQGFMRITEYCSK